MEVNELPPDNNDDDGENLKKDGENFEKDDENLEKETKEQAILDRVKEMIDSKNGTFTDPNIGKVITVLLLIYV